MSLRVLITNNNLARRAGTELYVRDLATALIHRGFSPVAYSSALGDVAQELRAATVPVVDRLDAIALRPHVIHGHHHLETMTALLYFADVPAIFFCHGWIPWEEIPPAFPRILRYVAVDQTCFDRLVFEHGIPEERVRLLFNFVDLQRFRTRPSLPMKPKRALVFSNDAGENNSLPMIRKACSQANVELDSVGAGSRNVTRRPEDMLLGYDLVFAKGRSALEALGVGAAVILCGTARIGPMVTTENMERLRKLNFGVRALQNPMEHGILTREMARYNPVDAAQVCSWVRRAAALDGAVDDLVSLYREVIDEYAQMPRPDPAAEMQAASNYLQQWMRLKHEREIQRRVKRERRRNLRHRMMGIPSVGNWLKSLARMAVGSMK